jgi:hypothetical protein
MTGAIGNLEIEGNSRVKTPAYSEVESGVMLHCLAFGSSRNDRRRSCQRTHNEDGFAAIRTMYTTRIPYLAHVPTPTAL